MPPRNHEAETHRPPPRVAPRVTSIVFWPPVKRIALVAALVVAVGGLGVLLVTPRGRAQVNLTLETAMTKGPASAKVTIVEFSDYQ